MTVGDSIEVVHVGVGGECMNALSKCLHRVCRKASRRPLDVLKRLVEGRTMYEEAIGYVVLHRVCAMYRRGYQAVAEKIRVRMGLQQELRFPEKGKDSCKCF